MNNITTDTIKSAGKTVEYVILIFFFFGIFLAFFYDSWIVAFGVGIPIMVLYYATKELKKNLLPYISSLLLGVFVAQFIYQMHGLFEMHFTAFIAIIALISYEEKWVLTPAVAFIAVHHATFAFLQYSNFVNPHSGIENIYFTQLDYMDLQTFLFHVGILLCAVVLAALYADRLKKRSLEISYNISELQQKNDQINLNIDFANKIAQGDYSMNINIKDDDTLGTALRDMKEKLSEAEEQKMIDEFVSKGLNEASTIIREFGSDPQELSDKIITFFVKYLGFNQGALFITDDADENVKLVLKGCYAYDRKKYLEKEIMPGEGLVGQAYLEKDIVYLTDIPENYISITSGLGQALPRTILIVPILNQEEIEGVLELATFKEIPHYQINFTDEVAKILAASLSSLKASIHTNQLYTKSLQQSEELRAQEEEMRQNLEELSSTQEEMERKQREYERLLEEANNTIDKLKMHTFVKNGIL